MPKLEAMTGGTLTIELLPVDAVVPRRETAEAIAVGILDGDLTSINYFAGIDPAFALMGDLIAGYDSADQIQAFCAQGGGKEMLQKLYDAHFPGVHVVGCGAYAREAFVSKVPVRGVADLKGLKIRSPEGLAADVFKRAGAAPVSMSGSETYGALEKGVIDAADNSAYANNDANGMHDIAHYPIFPGIHSTPILQFTISDVVWQELTEAEQIALETWYLAAYNGLRQHFDRLDRQLVARDRAAFSDGSGKVEVIDWPQAERDALRVIHSTAAYTPHALAAGPQVPGPMRIAMRRALENAAASPSRPLAPLGLTAFTHARDADWDDVRALEISPADAGLNREGRAPCHSG